MVSKFFKLLNRDITTVNQAALLIAIFSIVSQLFGLLRDRLLASFVGPSAQLDVYYAAFRIPDFVYNSIAALFSITVLIPFITSILKQDEEKNDNSFKKFIDSIFSVYCIGMIVICLIVAIFIPFLTKIVAPGFNIIQNKELILYSRIMLLSPFLMGLASLLGSLAQVKKKFLSFAIAPLFYNIGILFGILFLLPKFGIIGVVLGVALGALLYLVIQLPTLLSLHKSPKLIFNIDWVLIKNIIKLSFPRALGLSLGNISFLMISAVASLLISGSISIFQFSYNIETTPLIIIGVSYAVAVFPTLTKLYIDNHKKDFLDMFYRTTRNIFFLSIPVSFFIIVLRAHVVRILLGSGVFSWNDTKLVAASLALFSISVTAQCMVFLLVRAFYAMGNTKTPLKINILSILVTGFSIISLLFLYKYNINFNFFMDSILHIENTTGSNVVILALAYSIGQIINALLLWKSFHYHINQNNKENKLPVKPFFHIVGSGIISASFVYIVLWSLGGYIDHQSFIGILMQTAIAGFVGIFVYILLLKILKNEDIDLFIGTIKSKFWKIKPIFIGQKDL